MFAKTVEKQLMFYDKFTFQLKIVLDILNELEKRQKE
jgi:hypothetical protein